MTPFRPRRLRVLAVTTALVAGLVTAILSTPAATAGSSTAALAPQAAGSASGFALFVLPGPQPACSGLATDSTGDPFLDRESCGFVNFTPTGVTGTLTAELYAEGASSPFATRPVTTPAQSPALRRVSLQPDDTWPAGGIRLVIKEGTDPIGEFEFNHNQLVATLDTDPGSTAPGAAFDVTGSIEMHSARDSFTDTGVPATFTLNVVAPDGDVLHTADLTAASDGAISHTVPAAATNGITADTVLRVEAVDAEYTDTATSIPPTGAWVAGTAGTTAHLVDMPATNLTLENSFVSSVGWVKPGQEYPSRIIVTNPTSGPLTPEVVVTSPQGATFLTAEGPGTHPVTPGSVTWQPGPIAPDATVTLVLTSKAAPLTGAGSLDTIVWRDLSTSAVMTVPTKPDETSDSHGPKVIPPSSVYDTARYGDRPFPVVPVQYTDRAYQPEHSGDSLESVINDPAHPGSTFNLFQEMSLGQLYPDGTVPSAGIASADFDSYPHGFDFSNRAIPGNTCRGATYEDGPGGATANPLYTERITDGVYNLPGMTEYYGSDSNGSALPGAVGGVGALQNIDSGCGETGKLVYDAAALADPETDYSDYDTDKDGLVDFFMVVFAGCGGHGASQLTIAGCEYPDAPYDNVWPHSSSLEYGYSDPVTGKPGFVTDDQLKNLRGEPLWYTDTSYTTTTTTPGPDNLKVFVRVGPYNVNPETAIDFASVISHEYGHSLGLPDFYSTGSRETYGDWNLMATDKSQNMDAYSRQELGWVVPEVLDGNRAETGITDSKQDIDEITWQKADGTPYTLVQGQNGVGRVQNSKMYAAKLPGRRLLDPAAFTTGDGATPTHLWWSGSGNDFGCTPDAGRNFDLSIPELANIPAASTVTLSFKSRWDIEWDYDYGFVLTTTDSGDSYTSHPSENGYTTPGTQNPNANQCMTTYGNGITGTSGSYAAGTEAADRLTSTYPEPVFLADEYDISDLAGEPNGALRFSYATDPGLSRPGWFIDDVKVTVDEDGTGPDAPYDVWVTDFESSGGPDDSRVFNGGCREDLSTADRCTLGWKYLQAGAESEQDHAYYMEMRDRSGFDLDGKGQADRGAPAFQAGFYLSYTDEAHGYGNAGTDDPPAQSPLDSVPQPGNSTPNLHDAAFIADPARSTYSDDPADPHVDNYEDPNSESGNWEFAYDCLDFTVNSMSGHTEGPPASDGDLTGNVTFAVGPGCGDFNYGYTPTGGAANTAPVAAASANPSTVELGTKTTLSASGSTDAQTPNDLDYSWDFGNGGTTKDAAGKIVEATYAAAGTYTAKVTVTDLQGLSSTATATVVVKDTRPVAKLKITPKKPFITTRLTLSGAGSTGLGLTYSWNFGDGGTKTDATGQTVRAKFKKPGYRTVRLTVTDTKGRTSTAKQRLLVRRAVSCSGRAVADSGSWRVVRSLNAPKGDYCDNLGRGPGPDTLTYGFRGKQLDIYHGRVSGGGTAAVFIDGRRRGTIDFDSADSRLRFRFHKVITGLSNGRHTVRLVVLGGTAYLDSFITIR